MKVPKIRRPNFAFARWLGRGYVTARGAVLGAGAAVGLALLGGLARLLAFPVIYVRDKAWQSYFALVAAVLAYALLTLSVSQGSTFTLILLAGSVVAAVAGGLYHLLRHRWAGAIGLTIAALMIVVGVVLLKHDAPQVSFHNAAMEANAAHEWAAQNQLLEGSLAAYERDLRRNQLWQLIFPHPPSDVAALAHFHKANGLLQTPGKGKDAYSELCKSLMRNPGNRYIGLTAEEAAKREDDARHAQRNLEKLIRSGQDGGKGQPNGKQGQGDGKPQPGQKRDPGKEPQPSSGRAPRNSL